MNIITLNTWGGRVYEPLVKFLKERVGDTDVFCFQEVSNGEGALHDEEGEVTNLQSQIQDILKGYRGFYAEAFSVDHDGVLVPYGVSMFVKESITVVDYKVHEIFVPSDEPRLQLQSGVRLWNRLLQSVMISLGDQQLTVFNLHGVYTGGGKSDEPARLEQSQKVKAILDSYTGEKIICGDFNTNPETESMRIMETGMRNLVKEYYVTSTRSAYYKKEGKFADYILITNGLQISDFRVLSDVISDHLPLLLSL